jgi:hypothetical protein
MLDNKAYTHSEYVSLIALPRQQRSRERESMLRLHVHCLFCCRSTPEYAITQKQQKTSRISMTWFAYDLQRTQKCNGMQVIIAKEASRLVTTQTCSLCFWFT